MGQQPCGNFRGRVDRHQYQRLTFGAFQYSKAAGGNFAAAPVHYQLIFIDPWKPVAKLLNGRIGTQSDAWAVETRHTPYYAV